MIRLDLKGLVWFPSDEKRMQSLEFLHPHSNEYLFSGPTFRVGATCFNRSQSFGKNKTRRASCLLASRGLGGLCDRKVVSKRLHCSQSHVNKLVVNHYVFGEHSKTVLVIYKLKRLNKLCLY
jgi:hypothetical protein